MDTLNGTTVHPSCITLLLTALANYGGTGTEEIPLNKWRSQVPRSCVLVREHPLSGGTNSSVIFFWRQKKDGRSLLSQEGLHVRYDIIDLHADVLLGAKRRDPVIIGFPIDMAISLLADVALERGDESILHEAPAEIFRKVLNLNKYEFNYQKAPIAVAHEYFNPGLNIYEAGLSEREILRTMIDSAKETFIVRAKDPTQYATLILNNINSIRS